MQSVLSPLTSVHQAELAAGHPTVTGLLVLSLTLCIAALAEQQTPMAAIFTLLAITGGVGVFHGILDIVLLVSPRPTQSTLARSVADSTRYVFSSSVRSNVMRYGTTVAFALVAFASHPPLALVALLLMSIWHFGEVFTARQQRPATPLWFRVGERIALGAASVVLPLLFSRDSLHAIVDSICAHDNAAAALVWSAWKALFVAWAGVVSLWCVATALRLKIAKTPDAEAALLTTSLRWVAMHTAYLCVVFAVVSPVMGFALYFGLYHAPAHIRRVLSAYPQGVTRRAKWLLGAIYALTLAIAASVFYWVGGSGTASSLSPALLQTFVIVIAAVSLPHIVLISQRKDEL